MRWTCLLIFAILPLRIGHAGQVYVRFNMLEPKETTYYLRLGGYIHNSPWYLPRAIWPNGADSDAGKRVPAGEFTPWFDLAKHAGDLLHGRLQRAGGIAEFPNVTADFIAEPLDAPRKIVIELATAPDSKHVVRRFEESFSGTLTSFLVSPDLAKDKDSLETASEMTERRLKWAREATGGKRVSPRQHIIQTGFWAPQRPELNIKEAEVLWLLGFNTVGNQFPEVRAKFPELLVPGHTHNVLFGPGASPEAIDSLMKQHAENSRSLETGVPFGFADEVVCGTIGEDSAALANFHAWLAKQGIAPRDLGVSALTEVVPIESPEAFREREKGNGPAARRVFYYTSRFRQEIGSDVIRWHTEALHRHSTQKLVTTTLVADHPYFGGTGLGMGMVPNTAWGSAPLALDWFDMARKQAVDMAGIEDWMGLQYMYGPRYTWEGFQLMGFQASIFRSGSRGAMPIIAWITPSDETNLRLKSASALCQGAKHFFYWTYGPTATSTENYWSDLRGAYDGIAKITRQLAAAEHIIGPGKTRKTSVALLYSISADLWQSWGYIHMLERRATYLALVHNHYLVDMLTEQDIESGRLDDYDVLYVTDPNITDKAADIINNWLLAGGFLYGSCGAGSRNEFNEEAPGLARAFGIMPLIQTKIQEGEYRVRGGLNSLSYLDKIIMNPIEGLSETSQFGALGVKVAFTPTATNVIGAFEDKSPAALIHEAGKGKALYIGACPGLSYLKDAAFAPSELKEKYPAAQRAVINAWARAAGAQQLLELSHPVVEAGIYDAEGGTALVLANFTYEPIEELKVRLPVTKTVRNARSVENGPLEFSIDEAPDALKKIGFESVVTFTTKLGLNDVIIVER